MRYSAMRLESKPQSTPHMQFDDGCGILKYPKKYFIYTTKIFVNMLNVIIPPTKGIIPYFLMSEIGQLHKI